jgi:hypothetical protein
MSASVAVRLPAWLNTVSASYPAENDRLSLSGLLSPSGTVLSPRGGVLPYGSSGGKNLGYVVAQTGTPSMAVTIDKGTAVVVGTTSANQAGYIVTNDTVQTLAVSASDATNPRIDLVCLTIEDSQYAGSNDDAIIQVITGTPAINPSAPATPASSLVLAQVLVPASTGSIVTADITDKRSFTVSAGGTISCLSTDHPVNPPIGTLIFETDTGIVKKFTSTGWSTIGPVGGRWARTSGTQSPPISTRTVVSFPTTRKDPLGFMSGSGTTITIPTGLGGQYLVTACVGMSGAYLAGDYIEWSYISGGTAPDYGPHVYRDYAGSSSFAVLEVSALVSMSDGQIWKVNLFQTEGSPTIGANNASLEIIRLGDL